MARNYFSELEILIVRPFNYTGPGQASHFLIPKLVEHYVQKKSEIKLGNIDVFREFNDVRYICQLYQLALQSEFKSTHVNFCTGYVYSINEIIEILSKVTNFKVTVKINRDLIRAHDIKSLSGSTRKLNRTLGKPAIDYSIESTLVSMIED